MSDDSREFARSIIDSDEYRARLAEDLKAGRAAPSVRNMLLRYARQTEDSDGRRHARDVLQRAEIQW